MSGGYLDDWQQEYAVDVNEERGIARMLVPQDTNDFPVIRQGGIGVSIGASTVAKAIGVSQEGPPKQCWTFRLYPWVFLGNDRHGNEITSQEPDERTQSNFDHGHRFEPVTRKIWSVLNNNQRCYEGCVWRARNDDPIYTKRVRWETKHLSPDGVTLLHEPRNPITRREIVAARQHTDKDEKRAMVMELRSRMAPMDDVYIGLEYKNPVHCLPYEVSKEHVAQTQYQAWGMDVPYIDYVSTLIDKQTMELQGVFYARVHRSERYIAWMNDHVRDYTACLYNHREPWWGVANERDIPKVHIEIKARGRPETMGLPPDIVQQGLREAEASDGLFW